MNIEVIYAIPSEQKIIALELQSGVTVLDAVNASGVCDLYPEIEVGVTPVGIFGEKVEYDTLLTDGDRVEVYRPLLIDPMEARRLRARSQTLKGRE